jgi:hypothetical protein
MIARPDQRALLLIIVICFVLRFLTLFSNLQHSLLENAVQGNLQCFSVSALQSRCMVHTSHSTESMFNGEAASSTRREDVTNLLLDQALTGGTHRCYAITLLHGTVARR